MTDNLSQWQCRLASTPTRYGDTDFNNKIVTRVHCTHEKQGEKEIEARRERERKPRCSNGNAHSPLGLGGSNCGFQVPGRLRPSAPIKGRGALRASANLCALLPSFLSFFAFSFFLISLSLSFYLSFSFRLFSLFWSSYCVSLSIQSLLIFTFLPRKPPHCVELYSNNFCF